MAPYTPQEKTTNGLAAIKGPHPSFIQVANPYVFEQKLQECMTAIGVTEGKEDNIRLQGVTWIDNVRKALQLPVRTYNTAVVYYHKFRLVHPDNEYDYRDAAAAALFNACKIEDTLKKSRDILCAAYNLKLSPAEHLSPDDALFDSHSKTILGLERLMLEASGFDFRNRYPQKILMKLIKGSNLDRETAGVTAYNISLDLYRTFAPLKQTTQTMALACLELAIRVCDVDLASVTSEHGFDYDRWGTSRPEIMETLVDLLDLYTHHRVATLVGPSYPLETFIGIRIALNQEASAHNYPRYTEWLDAPQATPVTNDNKTPGIAADPKPTNGKLSTPASISPQSPSCGTASAGERSKDGTVRFMLDPGRAKDEKMMVHEYFRTEEVEEFVEMEVEIPLTPSPDTSPPLSSSTTPFPQVLTVATPLPNSALDDEDYTPPDIIEPIGMPSSGVQPHISAAVTPAASTTPIPVVKFSLSNSKPSQTALSVAQLKAQVSSHSPSNPSIDTVAIQAQSRLQLSPSTDPRKRPHKPLASIATPHGPQSTVLFHRQYSPFLPESTPHFQTSQSQSRLPFASAPSTVASPACSLISQNSPGISTPRSPLPAGHPSPSPWFVDAVQKRMETRVESGNCAVGHQEVWAQEKARLELDLDWKRDQEHEGLFAVREYKKAKVNVKARVAPKITLGTPKDDDEKGEMKEQEMRVQEEATEAGKDESITIGRRIPVVRNVTIVGMRKRRVV